MFAGLMSEIKLNIDGAGSQEYVDGYKVTQIISCLAAKLLYECFFCFPNRKAAKKVVLLVV